MAGRKTSGPGKFSRRTDTDRPTTPGLGRPGDPTDLQYGDVQKLEAGAKIAGGRPVAPAPDASRRTGGLAAVPGGLPPFLLDQPTARPGEPDTTGLVQGPGAGPEALEAQEPPDDLRILTTHFIAKAFDNKAAAQLEQELIDEMSRAAEPAAGPVPQMERPGPPTPGYAGEDVFAPTLDEAMAEPEDTGGMPEAVEGPAQLSPSEPPVPEEEQPKQPTE